MLTGQDVDWPGVIIRLNYGSISNLIVKSYIPEELVKIQAMSPNISQNGEICKCDGCEIKGGFNCTESMDIKLLITEIGHKHRTQTPANHILGLQGAIKTG